MMPMHIFKKITFIIVFALFAKVSNGQTVSFELDSILNKTLDSLRGVIEAKSVSAAMQFPNGAIWAGASGISSENPTVAVNTKDAYLIGSVTKTIIAACILQLADEHKLNLDDSIYRWVGAFNYIDSTITIRQLLRHQSGLYDVFTHPNCQATLLAQPDSIWSAEDLIRTFIQPAIFKAGTNWSYCNTNYFLLGIIIEKVTGNPFYKELRNRFFSPLQMSTIAIPAFETLKSPVAHVWIDLDKDGKTDDANDFYMGFRSLNAAGGAAGGYFATPTDMAKWIRTYMRGDLHSDSLINQAMTTVSAPGLPGATYGLGLMKKKFQTYQGYGHGGDLSYAASVWYFPVKDLSITAFTNDSRNNSWTLIPVINALLKAYNKWVSITNGVVQQAAVTHEGNVFPNPFDDRISLALKANANIQDARLRWTNMMGEQIDVNYNKSLSENSYIVFDQLHELKDGVYCLTITYKTGETETYKVVKARLN
jgi:D-alanyl-D-alanine carboxypeptidase